MCVSPLPVLVLTDSLDGLEFLDPHGPVRVHVVPAPDNPPLANLAPKTRYFFDVAPSLYPGTDWFVRVTDDSIHTARRCTRLVRRAIGQCLDAAHDRP